MIVVVGAYPAAPRPDTLAEGQELEAADDAFTAALVTGAAELGAGGLELAWQEGRLHPREASHLAALPPDWRHVVTTIPDTMIAWRSDPTFGLASPDDGARSSALGRLATLRDRLAALSEERGSAFAAAVLIHSAPRLGDDVPAATRALAASLREASSWDWNGAELLVEHCDAGDTTHQPAKGFLPLGAEIVALRDAAGERTPIGAVVNWGRSVIEGRSREIAVHHVDEGAKSGLLRGLMFSGVAVTPGPDAWRDNHLPSSDLCPESLLRASDVSEAMAAADRDNLLFAGVKVNAAPASTAPTERAADVNTVLGHVVRAASVLG